MPIIELSPLRGLASLSEQKRQAFKDRQIAAGVLPSTASDEDFSDLYDNIEFLKQYGAEQYRALTPSQRRDKLLSKAIQDKAPELYGDDYNVLNGELDDQGWIDLYNSDYLGSIERDKKYKDSLSNSEKTSNQLKGMEESPYTDDSVSAGLSIGRTIRGALASHRLRKDKKNDEEIRNKLFSEVQERREADSKDAADAVYSKMVELDNSGDKKLSDFYNEFDKMATEHSPHYQAFKNSTWLENYTDEDKLKDYADYMVIANNYGEATAQQYFDRKIQNKVAEAQNGKWTGNTLKGIATTIWSDLGANIALYTHIKDMVSSPERMAIWNQGKNPDKPIYDDNGNIVDYEENTNLLTNPAYWNDVYKYNTFSTDEIKAVKERGGISEDINVRAFGEEPSFVSFETIQEGIKQAGHMVPFYLETALTGGLNKWVGKGILKLAKARGLSEKALAKATKVGKIANDIEVTLAGGASGAQLESMGTFDEQMQIADAKIKDLIRNELHDYYTSIDYNTPEAKQAIDSYYQQLKQEDINRVASESREGVMAVPTQDVLLQERAKQFYTNQLLEAEGNRLEEVHKKDKIAAAEAIAKAYQANFVMDLIKEAPFDLALRKFQYAKGSRTGALDNAIDDFIKGAEGGGVKRATEGARKARHIGFKKFGFDIAEKEGKEASTVSTRNLIKNYLKLRIGGFADEYLDGVNASFAGGIASNEFDNYINKTYNPEAYNAVVDNMLGNLLAGVLEGTEGLTDRQNLYEGFIGAIAPGVSVMVNPKMVFSPKDTWRAILKGKDAQGNTLNFLERASNVLMNPLLNTYSDLKAQDRNISSIINAINETVSANRDKLSDASKIISTLQDYSNPLTSDDTSLLDSQDRKFYNAFTLADALNSLASIDGSSKSSLYEKAVHTIEGLSEGSLSQEEMDEEIDSFLANPENKSILEKPNGREIAAERLQKNAQYFMDMRERLSNIRDLFAKTSSMKFVDPRVQTLLAYTLVGKEDYKNRLGVLEEELGLSATNTEASYSPNLSVRYGTVKSREKAVQARERILRDIQKQIDQIDKDNEESQKTIKIDEGNLVGAEATKADKLNTKIKAQKNLIDSRNFQKVTLEEQKELVQDELNGLSNMNEEPIEFTEDMIMGLDARDRAFVFNEDNRSNYSKEQKKVLDKVKKKLLKDPDALTKIQDAGILAERIEDADNLYSKILSNDKLASTYFDVVSDLRDRSAIAEVVEQGVIKNRNKLNKAYKEATRKRNPNKQALKEAVLYTGNSSVVKAYVDDNPEQAEQIQPYNEMLRFTEDIASVINNSDATDADKSKQKTLIWALALNFANDRKELSSAIERYIDSSTDENLKQQLNTVMDGMSNLGYLRDATVLENRKQQQKREEDQKRRDEEAKQRLEAETKAAEERAAQETARKQAEVEENKKKENDDEISNFQPNREESLEGAEPLKLKGLEPQEETPIQGQPVEEFPEEVSSEEETQQNEETSVIKDVKNIIENSDGSVTVMSPSMDESDVEGTNGTDIIPTENLDNPEEVNDIIGDMVNTKDNVLAANAMLPFHVIVNKEAGIEEDDTLKYGSKLTKKVGNPNPARNYLKLSDGTKLDSRNRYNRWMEQTMGIKLQEIIDTELSQILENNPNTKIKFLTIRNHNTNDVLDDNGMSSHLLLVVDYDNSINKDITSIHSDENGGVLESNGKQYLVVGVAGYGNEKNTKNTNRKALYDSLYTNIEWNKKNARLRVESEQFFANNPKERFYVSPNYETEVVPYSLTPGWIVKRLENEENQTKRKVSDLLNDEQRNPQRLTMENLDWGIQKRTGFVPIWGRGGSKPIMQLQAPDDNIGNVFLLVPAGNGKVIPSYIYPARYTELQRGRLKDRIDDIIIRLTQPTDVSVPSEITRMNRVNEAKNLSEMLLFSADGNNILISKDGNTITFKRGADGNNSTLIGGVIDLSKENARERFYKLLENLNPRISITDIDLMSPETLEEYDEAGALLTDLSMLHTVGSVYGIWGIGPDGKMLKPEHIENPIWNGNSNRNINYTEIHHNNDVYRYNKNTDTFTTKSGEDITDEDLLEELRYNLYSINHPSVYSRGEWDYYLIEDGETPKAFKVHAGSRRVKKATDSEVQNLRETIRKNELAKEAKAKEQAALDALNQMYDDTNVEDAVAASINDEITPKKENIGEVENLTLNVPAEYRSVEKNDYKATSPVQSFTSMMRKRDYQQENESLRLPQNGIKGLISETFDDSPVKYSNDGVVMKNATNKEIMEFLKSKSIEVDAIGTSENDIKAWIETIKNCR